MSATSQRAETRKESRACRSTSVSTACGHFYASMLIAKGSDVKVVQARLRHASAKTTLDTYAHLWPDADDSTRTAVDEVLAERAATLREAAE